MPGPNAMPISEEVDSSIGDILIGCPEGHGSAMTVNQALNDLSVPENIRDMLRAQIGSVDTLVDAGIDREKAITISLGGLAIRDKNGAIARAQAQPESSIPQPTGSKKK